MGIMFLTTYYWASLVSLFGLQSFLAKPLTAISLEPLRFTKDGVFQISVFEDLHYGEGTHILKLCVSSPLTLGQRRTSPGVLNKM
jgi:hypothetical protein